MPRKKNTDESRELFEKEAAVLEEMNVEDFVETNYLLFSWSVCLDRALVNVNDGLKPIQRRILFTAHKKGLTDKSSKMKSVIFEGDVLRYSPHGGCYSTIVNMAESESEGQPRSLRLPLIKGKGNWGGINTSTAAASRYTEMSLWPAAMELIKELEEDAVEMIPNYDGTLMEPKHLPARWPVALINGVPDAMAVGFACNLPCHNPDEVMDACIALMKNPDISINEIRKLIKGPDFNCGCDIIPFTEKDGKKVDGIKSYLETGSGTFIMRGKYNLEEKNGKYTIDFYSLPYKVYPEKVIEAIKSKYDKGGFKELSAWSDLSDLKHPVRLRLETKRNINIERLLADLYKSTPLQCTFAANNTVIKDMTPQKLDVKSILEGFLDHRKDCTKRKLNYRLNKKKAKLHIQEALRAVLVDIDKCISIIRKSDDAEIAKSKLMKTFKVDESQAEYILSLQLRKLTKSDSHEIEVSIDELNKEIKEIEGILGDEKKFNEFIISELEDTKKVISSPRKCSIIKRTREQQIEEEEIYISSTPSRVKRSAKKEGNSYLTKEGKFMIITDNGASVRSLYEIPEDKAVAYSRVKPNGKPIIACGCEGYLILIGETGTMKVVDLSTVVYPRKQDIDKVLAQPVKFAFITKELKGKIEVETDGKKKSFKVEDLPVYSLTAGGNKVYRKPVDNARYIAK